MKTLYNLRDLYTPIQPTVKSSMENVLYTEFLPDNKLLNHIYCYWQFKTHKPLPEQYSHRIVADGCIDIYFELNNPKESYVMGFCKKYTEFQLENSFNYIGIRFLPSMFPNIFNINAKELSNRFENLSNVNNSTAVFIENNFNANLSINDIKNNLDNYFLRLVINQNQVWDSRLYESIQIILKNQGVVQVEKDLRTGISKRQLQRLFEYYIGDNPKTFSKIIRFQTILRAKPSSQSLKFNKLFYDLGYYDQAHFIKDFKHLYGTTPNKAFGK